MKAERWQQVERLYHAVLECAPESRAAFLDDACAGDAELRQEVTSHLSYQSQAENFIEVPALEVAAERSSTALRHQMNCIEEKAYGSKLIR